MADKPLLPVRAEIRGEIPQQTVKSAVKRIRAIILRSGEPIRFARLKLTMASGGQPPYLAVAQANIDISGTLVRAQSAGQTLPAALDQMSTRLLARLGQAARQRNQGGQEGSGTPTWRPEVPHTPALPCSPRPPAKRTVLRRKSVMLERQDPAGAIARMELRDYDFYLFIEEPTSQDTIVYRTDSGYRLTRAHPRLHQPGTVSLPVTISDEPVPRLTLGAAIAHLEASARPFLFFRNQQTGRGNVLYHRYDGHYALITPAGHNS